MSRRVAFTCPPALSLGRRSTERRGATRFRGCGTPTEPSPTSAGIAWRPHRWRTRTSGRLRRTPQPCELRVPTRAYARSRPHRHRGRPAQDGQPRQRHADGREAVAEAHPARGVVLDGQVAAGGAGARRRDTGGGPGPERRAAGGSEARRGDLSLLAGMLTPDVPGEVPKMLA